MAHLWLAMLLKNQILLVDMVNVHSGLLIWNIVIPSSDTHCHWAKRVLAKVRARVKGMIPKLTWLFDAVVYHSIEMTYFDLN